MGKLAMRGRKHKWESRALEFYGRLARWKQTPESARPSLRALARQLGTSHQLLSHYLRSWAKWQAKECRRQAEEIRASANFLRLSPAFLRLPLRPASQVVA